LKAECLILLENEDLPEGLGCALSFESWDNRPEIVEGIIKDIAYMT
jgi:hypothetical protein